MPLSENSDTEVGSLCTHAENGPTPYYINFTFFTGIMFVCAFNHDS